MQVERFKLFQSYAGHSPAPWRVNVALSNMPEFAQDFNCPAGNWNQIKCSNRDKDEPELLFQLQLRHCPHYNCLCNQIILMPTLIPSWC